jgi:hypothetical protein
MSKIITEEVEFMIKVDNSEFRFAQYREEIYKAAYERLGHGYYNYNIKNLASPVETFVRERVKKALDNEEAIVFITSYSEREGSFLITFSFFVFATFMSYGSFRESLDYIRDDFNFFFRDTFPVGTNINVNYSTRQNRAAAGLQRNLLSNALSPIRRQLNILKSLIGLIGLLSTGFALFSVYKVENGNNTITTETIHNAVQTEVERLNTIRTNEELLKLLQELKKDTIKK